MLSGLLWFDNNKDTPVEKKIAGGAERYQEKFGKPATACYVHPSTLPEQELVLSTGQTVKIIHATTILKHHFWIGVE